MLNALARIAAAHPKRVLILAVLVFVVAGIAGAGVAERLHPYEAEDPDTESVIASERLERAGYRDVSVLVLIEGVDVRSREGAREVAEIAEQVRSMPEVAEVSGYAETGSPAFLSRGGDATYLAVRLHATDEERQQELAEEIAQALSDRENVSIGGWAIAQAQMNEKVESDLRRAEVIAFPILFLLSLLFFRSLVAALLPLLVGALAIVGTFAMLRVASELTSVSIFALNLVTGLGLGLAIDYSLFIVSRYREELARHGPGARAVQRTLATAGRTVLYSSLTVAGALASLMVFPQQFLYSMGIGGLGVALIAAAIALVVLPAVLALLGPRVNALAPRFLQRLAERDAATLEGGFWYRLSRLVMRRPGRVAVASAALLVALGLPFLSIKFTTVDARTLPESASAREVDSRLRADFPAYRTTPILLYVEGDRGEATRVAAAARELPGAATVGRPVALPRGGHLIEVISAADPLEGPSQELVRELRDLPGDALVTGFTAFYEDLHASLLDHLPLVLALICVVTLVVLFAMTGSLVLPLKQLVMNFLGLSAVFGILVLIFQDGRLEGLLAYRSQGGLESTQPLLLFAVAFGLSTDYGVFLLSRIKEAYDGGASNSEAVAIGLERTGRIVTAAALLFCIAIGAFVTSEIIFVKQLGLGTALAVMIDATIIRALLVPSLMALLGRWNWWAPAPLRRLHARFGLEET
jgi:RND superfamily putative drug exporter